MTAGAVTRTFPIPGVVTAALYGRDVVSLASVQRPRDAFVCKGVPRHGERLDDAVAR